MIKSYIRILVTEFGLQEIPGFFGKSLKTQNFPPSLEKPTLPGDLDHHHSLEA